MIKSYITRIHYQNKKIDIGSLLTYRPYLYFIVMQFLKNIIQHVLGLNCCLNYFIVNNNFVWIILLIYFSICSVIRLYSELKNLHESWNFLHKAKPSYLHLCFVFVFICVVLKEMGNITCHCMNSCGV